MNPLETVLSCALLGCVATAQHWSPVHAMRGGAVAGAFDEDRGRAVVLAGDDQRGTETWEWTGASWQRSAAGAPLPLMRAATAYDATRGRLVAFGAAAYGTSHSTYEWDGLRWEPKNFTWVGPSSRSDVAMTFDVGAGRVLMFGGQGGGNELWQWDGVAWTRVPLANPWPSPRLGAAMAHDPARGRIVLFGGWTGVAGSSLGDTWEWNGSAWSQVGGAGPQPRQFAAMAYDAATQRVVLTGGMGAAGRLADTWSFDGVQWSQLATPVAPPARVRAAMIGTPGGLLLVGGQSDFDLDDTWQWSGGAWTVRRQGDNVWPVVGHAVVHDDARRRLTVFGGHHGVGPGAISATGTWTWNGTWTRLALAFEPPPRTGCGMTYDRARGTTVLFGGADGPVHFGDTWTFDGTAWTQHTNGPQPAPRTGHGLAYDVARQRVVLFGGAVWTGATPNHFGDTWTFDGTSWRQETPAVSPAPQFAHRFVHDDARARTVLVGGTSASTETWEWDGADWALRHTAPGGFAQVVYDRGLHRVLGIGNGSIVMWDGTEWTTAPVAPTPAHRGVIAHDATRGRLVAVGGYVPIPEFERYGRTTSSLLVHGPTPAAVVPFGSGCGAGEPAITTTGLPSIGNSECTVDVRASHPAAAVFVAIGFSAQQIPLGSGCTLLVGDVGQLSFHVGSAGGYARAPLSIPNQFALRGLHVFCQGATLGAGLATSSGLRVEIGD